MANVTLNVSSNQNITYNIDSATTSITVQLNGASGNVVSLAGTTRCTVSGTSPYPSGTVVTISGFTRGSTYTAIFACTVGSGTASTTYTVVLSGSVAALNTYSITAPASINEGSAGTINVASNVNGTYYWTVEPSGDFGTSSGSVSISSGTGSFTVTPSADVTSEGPETATVRLRSGSTSGTILASDTFTINDTSYPAGGGGSYSVSYDSNSQYRYADVYSTQTVSANISTGWSTYYVTTSNLPTGASVNPASTSPGGSLLYSFTSVAKDNDGQYYQIYIDGNGGSEAGRSYLRVYVYNTITAANGSLSAPTNDINSTATITFTRSSAGTNGTSGDQYMWSTSASMPAYNDAGWATLGSSDTLASVPRGQTRYLHIQRWTYRQGSTSIVGKRETRTLSHTVGWPDAGQFVTSYCSDYNTYTTYTDGSGGTYDSQTGTNDCDGYNTLPAAFTLTDVSQKEKSTSYTSNEITVSGLVIRVGESVSASCNAGTLYKNGAAVSGNSTTAVNGDKFKIALTSSSSYSTAVSSTLNIGGRTESYIVTTRAQDVTPTFELGAGGTVQRSVTVTSVEADIAGMDSDASVTASFSGSGEYRIYNGSTWSAWKTSDTTGVTNGYKVQVRHTSSSSFATATTSTLTVGGRSDSFTSTTVAKVNPDTSVTFSTNSPVLFTATSFNLTTAGAGATTTYRVRTGSYTGTVIKTFTGSASSLSISNTPALSPGTTYYVTGYVSDTNNGGGTADEEDVGTFTVIRSAEVFPDTTVTITPSGNISTGTTTFDKVLSNANSNSVTDYRIYNVTDASVEDSYTSTATGFTLTGSTPASGTKSYKVQARVPTSNNGDGNWDDLESFTVTKTSAGSSTNGTEYNVTASAGSTKTQNVFNDDVINLSYTVRLEDLDGSWFLATTNVSADSNSGYFPSSGGGYTTLLTALESFNSSTYSATLSVKNNEVYTISGTVSDPYAVTNVTFGSSTAQVPGTANVASSAQTFDTLREGETLDFAVTNGALEKNGSGTWETSGTIDDGDTYKLRGNSSNTYGTNVTVTVTFSKFSNNKKSETWIVVNQELTAPTGLTFVNDNDNSATEDVAVTASGGTGGTLKVSADGTTWYANGTKFDHTRGSSVTYYARREGVGDQNSSNYTDSHIVYPKPPTALVFVDDNDDSVTEQVTVTASGGYGGTLQVSDDGSTWYDNGTKFDQTRDSSATYYAKRDSTYDSTTYSDDHIVYCKAPTDLVFSNADTESDIEDVTVTASGGYGGTLKVSDDGSTWVANGSTFDHSRNTSVTYYAKRESTYDSTNYPEPHTVDFLDPESSISAISNINVGSNTTSYDVNVLGTDTDELARITSSVSGSPWPSTPVSGSPQSITVTTPDVASTATYTVEVNRPKGVGGSGSWISSGQSFDIVRSANAVPTIGSFVASPSTAASGETVTLSVTSVADSDGTIETLDITQASGTTITLSSQTTTGLGTAAASASRTFTAPDSTETLTFTATATDDDGASFAITISVNTVEEGGSTPPPTEGDYGVAIFGPNSESYLAMTDRTFFIKAEVTGSWTTSTSSPVTVTIPSGATQVIQTSSLGLYAVINGTSLKIYKPSSAPPLSGSYSFLCLGE